MLNQRKQATIRGRKNFGNIWKILSSKCHKPYTICVDIKLTGNAFLSNRPSYSIFVGELDQSVTDDKLEDFFMSRYRSVKGAKIVYEDGGISR